MKRMFISLLAFLLCISGFYACTEEKPAASTTTKTEPAGLLGIVLDGKSDYSIIIPETATDALKELSARLVNGISELSGAKPSRFTDNTKKYAQTQHEILLGPTNRGESAAALQSIDGTGWKTEANGQKIIIAATNDAMLEKAVENFLESALSASGGNLYVSEALNLTYDGASDMIELLTGGKLRFDITVPAGDISMISLAGTLSANLKSILNCTVQIGTDSKSADDSAYEILIGETNRRQSRELYEALGIYELKVAVNGNKIVIGSDVSTRISDAVTMFINGINSIAGGSYNKKYMISKDFTKIKSLNEWGAGIPLMSAGLPLGTTDFGDDTFVSLRENTVKSDFEAYVNLLKQSGYTLSREYTLGGNSYVLLTCDKNNVYISYLDKIKTTRIYSEKTGTLYPASEKADYEKLNDPVLWQLPPDVLGVGANGGMSYVIKVEDGSFIIIDGGYETDREAENLYNFLVSQTKQGEKPIISAWFITHLHSDHFGCMKKFTEKYLNDVTVNAFYYNFPNAGYSDLGAGLATQIYNSMSKWKDAKIYGKLHSGMSFWIADAKIEIVFTHEDIYPDIKGAVVNDTSTVIKITAGGQTLMFLADIQDNASAAIMKTIDASVLKSDIVQFAHHGYEGATVAMYEAIDAPVVLWPMNIYGNQVKTPTNVFENWLKKLPANKYIAESDRVKKIIVAGEGITRLDLPYTYSGDRLPDYKAIHDRLAAE